jgi:hypothetical protein
MNIRASLVRQDAPVRDPIAIDHHVIAGAQLHRRHPAALGRLDLILADIDGLVWAKNKRSEGAFVGHRFR